MAVPRLSQGAESARIAAAQAEFNEKKWVWVPDDKEGYLAGWVIREEDDSGEVVMAAGGEMRRLPLYALSKMNPPKFDRVDDIADLTFLNEASVVHNLRLRYGSGAIYTYSSLFLVAINPYQNLPLYSDAIVQQYRGKRRDENPPHIFAVAERAWVSMGEERENQSILITGESGAGKTENTKKVIQYLAAIASDVHSSHTRSPSLASASSSFNSGLPRSQSMNRKSISSASQLSLTAKGRLGLLERQILQANPILEAFGNAQTQRNNNSSRFGKFIRISFAPDGSIAGANVDWYLLEKSRVVVRSEAERSFHVFYQLMEADLQLKEQLLLDGGVEDYEFLNKSRREVDGVDDREEWKQLKNALEVVGFSAAEQFNLFRIVAAILHIGNITITSTRADDALMPDSAQAERVCHLLGIPVGEFTKAVLRPRVLAGREWVTQARTRQHALDELSALCKTLYEKSFGALVDRINRALDRPSSKSTFIGVLDIAGFEIFDVNAYEQLLINYTNEKLQQFFNHHMFELEQEEYARESIEWEYHDFGLDSQPTIELIEASGNTIGILSCLDEECIMPKATDATFTHKLHQLWTGEVQDGEKSHPGRDKYTPARFEQGFIVKHYAGNVEYRTEGWLEKNKDPLNDNLSRLLAVSDEPYVAGLFSDYADGLPANGSVVSGLVGTVGKKRTVRKGAFRTVGQRHKEQLASLMNQLKGTQPHFVRCIVPNGMKKAGRMDVPLVLDQLRCNGVLEGIRIARLGYPNRLPFVEFRQRYEVLTPGIIPRGYMDGRKACLRMVDALELDKSTYRIGTSKLFFKAGILADLEERRDALLFDIFSRLQGAARMWTARRQMKKILNRAIAVRTIQRNARIYGELREWPWWQLYTKVRPLLAATRNDEELRRKEAELALFKERAERDLREKEALEGLKMRLEADKRKVEDDLEAERSVGLEKDVQLKRSADRISELEEDVSALQTDLDTLDSQLDRVMANHKATEEKYEALREAFDEAANHLVRFEQDQKEWKIREEELSQSLAIAEEKLEVLQAERDELRRASDDAKRQLTEREEDILRAKERLEATVTELEAKLASEIRARELAKARSDTLEHEVRQAQEQLAEMARTANQYDTLITKKEAEIARLTADLEHLSDEKDEALKEITQLQGQAETAKSQLDAQKGENVRSTEMRARLQKELDELRALMQAKSSEETRRKEVEKSKEKELLDLRTQQSRLQQELSESKKIYIEDQNRLKADLETALRENASLQQQYQQLVDSERAIQTRQKELDTALSDADRAKRTLESELQIAKTRQTDVEGQYADAIKAKEMLERQMASAQAKVEDYEEAVIQLEREKSNWVRQMDQTRQQLDDEKAKRQQLDKHASTQKAEILRLKDINIKLDRELNKTLDNLKAREWEVKQLESRQDKTIVEHVHVLEEAKRVTDRQLAEAQAELQKNVSYIRSLEKSKARLASEAEDLTRAAEQESRARAKDARTSEEKASRAAAEALDAKRAKEAAEIRARRSENELQTAKDQIAFLEQQLVTVQKSKSTLESELSTLADETTTPNSLAKVRREYESRISQLQNDLEQAEAAQSTANRIKDLVERHHAEIRKLILQGAPHDDGFRSRLLQELQQTEKGLSMEFSNRSLQFRDPGSSGVRSVTSTPTKSTNKPLNGIIRGMKEVPEAPRTPDHHQVDRLKQQVQVLELQMAASDRVRRHLEASLRDLTAELESLDGSKQSLQSYKARMAKENARLGELLNDEAQARRTSEASHLDGLQSMWDKFQSTISEERESYNRLEESRRALIVQQRNAQTELEAQRRQNQELTQMKMKLQSELTNLQDKVEREKLARSEESNTKRKLQGELQDAKVSSAAASMKHSELAEAVKAYRAKAESYLTRLEQNEIERAKAANGEAFARKALEDLEKAHAQALKERKAAEERASKAEQNLRDLSAELEHGDRQSSDLELGRQRLEEELQEERDRHAADLSERDFAMSQTQITYQTKLAELSDELQSQRESMSRLREENRKLRSDYDELQLQYDDEVYSGGAWKNEKERLETKITDLTNAYESSTAARTEQQSQIVALHSQVRELRGVLEDAEAERVMLQKARRALQAQLDGIKLDHIDPDKMSAESKLQDLQLKKQDLERALEEHQDRVMMAEERMKKAEVHAQDCQIELGEIRVENSELDRKNANLEKQVKELNVRIVDLETKAYASASRLKGEVLRQNRTGDRPVSRTGGTPAESDRMRSRLEEEVKSYEAKIAAMREDMAALSSKEGNLQIAKRKAEREASEYKQLVLSLEREVERLRSRLEWPSSALQSPAGSPRKYGS
ncbi:nonmuscle myosin heavy chain b [Fomitiporia mediterranea MF3/22]|uniref:nonmuscle myosin heavy chain b n=1 Tax=Fomitiporia mediterranea (strain MF3/22) TaxID=694068 RepID=UPI0004408960|nr:nonmuscle myosin heavy chain b [Fomitiporia mediterranea MF3/22]EJD07825.1 nonmuscle myosin heavy chain b [Fomitiporia mediterranea MF3/22]